ncbi:hypothetical protein ABZ904_08530 [Streptomyces sp. NPDC046900]
MLAVVAFVALVILTAGMPLAAPTARARTRPSWARGPIRAHIHARRTRRR